MDRNIASKDIFAFSWSFDDIEFVKGGTTDKLKLKVTGLTVDNKTVHVTIKNFQPFCYIELTKDIDANSFIDAKNTLNSMEIWVRPTKIELVKRKKLYYCNKTLHVDEDGKETYVDKEFNYIKCSFRSVKSLLSFKYMVKRTDLSRKISEIHGSNWNTGYKHEYGKQIQENEREGYGISPILMFCSSRDVNITGWLRVEGVQTPNTQKLTSCDYEYTCFYDQVKNCDDESLSKLIMTPKEMSFDIETYSSIKNKFCDARRTEDCVICICAVIFDCGVYRKYILTLGNPTCQAGETLFKYSCEKDLLLGFSNLILEENPNVILGYNIFGFDNGYLYDRARHYRIEKSFTKIGVFKNAECKVLKSSFQSGAYGSNTFVYFDAEGRLQVDLLPIVKRSYKLANYSLKAVTIKFEVETKDPLSMNNMFACYRSFLNGDANASQNMTLVTKYCLKDAEITLLLYKKLKMWYGLCESSKSSRIPIFYCYTEGTQISLYSQLINKCAKNAIIMDMQNYETEKVGSFVGGSVLQPSPGLYENVLSFDFASLYPSIMLAYGIDYTTLIKETPRILVGRYDTKSLYEDWKKFPCFVKMRDEGDAVRRMDVEYNVVEIVTRVYSAEQMFDEVDRIRGLYPHKMIIIYEIESDIPDKHAHIFEYESHTNCVHDQERKKKKNGEFSTAKQAVHCSKHRDRFIKQELCGSNGVITEIVSEKIRDRKAARVIIKKNTVELGNLANYLLKNKNDSRIKSRVTEMEKIISECYIEFGENYQFDEEKEQDTVEVFKKIDELQIYNVVLDKKQLAIKVDANSIYGGLAANKAPLYEGATSTTYRGRCSFDFISKFIPNNYVGKTVYGDSVTGDTPVLIRYKQSQVVRTYSDGFKMEIQEDQNGNFLNEDNLEIEENRIDMAYSESGSHKYVYDVVSIKEVGIDWKDYGVFKSHERKSATNVRRDKLQSKPYFRKTEVWTDGKWSEIVRVIKHRVNKKIYRVVTSKGCVDVTEDHSLITKTKCVVKPKDLDIGIELLHSFPDDFEMSNVCDDVLKESMSYLGSKIERFVDMTDQEACYLNSDELKDDREVSFCCKGKLSAQILYCYSKTAGYVIYLDGVIEDNYKFRMRRSTTREVEDECCKVREITELHSNFNDFVYDLETREGIFQAGVGEIVLKNTDSCHTFFPAATSIPEMLSIAKNVISDISVYFKAPMKLEFEKIYTKYLILTKKRYICQISNLQGKIIDNSARGVLLSRRDNCVIVREAYKDLSEMIMNRVDRNAVIQKSLDWMNKFFTMTYPVEAFTLSKSVNKDEYKTKTLPTHVVIAKRMIARGIDASTGTRVSYIFCTLGREMKKADLKRHHKAVDTEIWNQNKSFLSIDFLDYVDKQFVNHCDELLLKGANIDGLMKEAYQLRCVFSNIVDELKELNEPYFQVTTVKGVSVIRKYGSKKRFPIDREFKSTIKFFQTERKRRNGGDGNRNVIVNESADGFVARKREITINLLKCKCLVEKVYEDQFKIAVCSKEN